MRKLSNSEFIAIASKVHKNFYNYSLVNYKNNKSKVEIICDFHGVFQQRPDNHIYNERGCPICNGGKLLTQNEFLERCKAKHGDYYDYSLLNYKNMKSKIDIICKHGKFQQIAEKHLLHGCRKCSNSSSVSKLETKWLDLIGIPDLPKNRSFSLKIEKKFYILDGYYNGVIFEFLGDYFHGNPAKFKCNEFNKLLKKSFGELFAKTQERIRVLRSFGFKVVTIWESKFLALMKRKKKFKWQLKRN